ncbi:MAG: protease [Chlorobiaceae bacterium]|nr:protease [Chlorobiaceae bacterium]MBA4309036.1 protease [Chlorobiaceae bacterium]
MKKLFIIFNLFLFSFVLFAQQEARLLRFPNIQGNQLVFTYAGDLYVVSANGGVARKITNDIGYEMFAKFSPDGKQIAFTGQYDGNTEVYLMPSEGGVPKRLTYTATLNRDDVSDRMGPNNIVMAWKGNDEVLYRSRNREWNDWKGQLFLVNTSAGLSEQLPLPRGGFSSYSPDLSKLAYNRVFREFRTWKRYRGGQADDVWIFDFNKKTHENITNNPAQDIFPMWAGDKVYYTSDRTGRLNLFSYDLKTKETKQHTNYKDFDIKFPSLGNNAIAYEYGGYIYKFDLATEKASKVEIFINEDFNVGRGGWIDVSKNVTNFEISPDGKRALFGARGEVFTVPQKHGATRNLTQTSGIHERASKWSPDGKWIAYISDRSGEFEIWMRAQDGSGEEIQLTKTTNNYIYTILWSPDSKKLLFNDKLQRLMYVDVESKKVTLVEQAEAWEITSFGWSPDSKWITYTKPEVDNSSIIYIYSIDEKKAHPVTDKWYDSSTSEFSDDGKYLFLVSQRNFAPTYGQTEWNHIYQNMSKLYLITLAKDTESPFKPKSDEVTIKEEKKDGDKKETEKKDEKKSETVSVKIDFDGIMNRIVEIPVVGANYWNLSSVKERIYYMKNSSQDPKPKLFLYDLTAQKETELGDIQGYEISADKKKMLVGLEGMAFAIIDLPAAKLDVKERLVLTDLRMNLDRHAEWRQIYHESWRQMRDFFYASNMGGIDWDRVRKDYEVLLPYVNHRFDLTYIIGEMISELNTGHAYVGGGDAPRAERIKLGLLGADIVKDEASKYFQVKNILKGQNWNRALRSPLTEINVNVNEGDYILEVNGKPTNEVNDIYSLLVGTAGKQVTLTVNSKPEMTGSRKTVVVPIEEEQSLVYFNWVHGNIEKVSKASNGKVGYIHIPDMSVEGLNQFVKYFYPQLKKEALIIDVRGNGGGNVSPMIIERLQRTVAMIDKARNTSINPDPSGLHHGPKVCLLDEFSASDGDIFPFRFRHYNLGKLVGKRSWGGTVGIRGTLPIIDGGVLNRPEFASYDVEGKKWAIEGYGVDPDIFVDNDPVKEFLGIDEQLNKGIEVVLNELKNWKPLPPPPPYPDKR